MRLVTSLLVARSLASAPPLYVSLLVAGVAAQEALRTCVGCDGYDPKEVGDALRRRRAGAAVLYRGEACRHKGWVAHDFSTQIAANHRRELWEPLRRAFGSVDLYGHVAGPSSCVEAMRRTATWTRLDYVEPHTEHFTSRRWFDGSLDWFRGLTNGTAGFVVVVRPDIIFRAPVDGFLDAGRLNLFHFEDPNFGFACGARDRASMDGGSDNWATGDAMFAAPGRLFYAMRALGRSAGSDLARGARECCGDDALPAARLVNVLDTVACHNTRAFDWEPYYLIYGMRLCEEALRPGEREGDACLSRTRTAFPVQYYAYNSTRTSAAPTRSPTSRSPARPTTASSSRPTGTHTGPPVKSHAASNSSVRRDCEKYACEDPALAMPACKRRVTSPCWRDQQGRKTWS